MSSKKPTIKAITTPALPADSTSSRRPGLTLEQAMEVAKKADLTVFVNGELRRKGSGIPIKLEITHED